jgi:putative oxidoreductase
MTYLQKIEHWGEAHHPKYLDILRIALGIFLCFKGIEFARNSFALEELVGTQTPFSSFMIIILIHYILFAHIVGGFMLVIGLLTRVACIAQIPILLGAIIFVNWNVMAPFSGLLVALIVLFLLIYFLIIGSGPWSFDHAVDVGEIK